MTELNQEEQNELKDVEPLKHPQMNWKKRKFPKAPGFFPVPVDIVITKSMQLLLVFTNILVIFSSAAIDYDKDALVWIIFFMFVFTWVGFGLYIREIRKHALIYRRFFKCTDKCYYRENQKLENNEQSSCFCLRCICIHACRWLYALFIFPFIILWSVWKSYQYYRNQRKVACDDIPTDIAQFDRNNEEEYIKIAETAYGVSHLGVLSKQASMIVCFVQDIPLLILCAIIGNKLGLAVYSIFIALKFVFWVKHMIDVGRCTTFYHYEDYLLSFGLREVTWEVDTFGCCYALPVFITDDEKQKLLWHIKDYVKCLKSSESNEWVVMIIFAINPKKHEIIVVDPSFDNDFISSDELMKMIDDKGAYSFNRWDGGIQPLTNKELVEFLETRNVNMSENTDTVSSQSDKCSEKQSTQVNQEPLQVVVSHSHHQSIQVGNGTNKNENHEQQS